MKTFVEKFVAKKNLTDLDLVYPYYEGEESNDVMIPHNKLTYVNVPSMDIEKVLTILNEMKEKGANRIYIADNVDHQGYYFYGVKLMEI